MNNSDDTDPLPPDPVYDPVIPDNQFTYRRVLIFWNNATHSRVASKSPDS
jgi:hypothetical protein